MVFRKYLLSDAPIENVTENGEIIGFKLKMQEPDYRGLYLSCLIDIKVIVDGEEFSGDDITLTIASGTYSLSGLETQVFHRWNYIEEGTVFVRKPGGLAPGKHYIEAGIKTRSSQDNSVGGWYGGDGYAGGYRDFVIE